MKPVIVCIGASAGGVTAVQSILQRLGESSPVSLLVAQHFPEDARIDAAMVYGRYYSGKIADVCDKIPIEPRTAYFAPPGYHMQVERDLTISLSQDELVNFARPSIDVLFQSAAWSLGPKATGILLTGANADGALGLREIKTAGGKTIVQDPEEAEARFMPKSALEIMHPDFVLTLRGIASKILQLGGDKNEQD